MEKNVTIQAYNERAMGKGVYFHRLRRITGFLTVDISKWNTAKKAELKDRVTHT